MSTMQVTRIITEYNPALNGKPGVKRALHEILLLYPMIHTLALYQLESGLAMLQNFLPERLVRSISQNSYEKWRSRFVKLGGVFGNKWSQVGYDTSTGAKAETSLSGEAMRL
jgi:hypothetical protein